MGRKWEAAHQSKTLRSVNPIHRTIRPTITIPKPYFTHALHVTVSNGGSTSTTREKPTGDGNAQRPSAPPPMPRETLRHLRGKVWPRPLLLLANRPLFKAVR